MCAQIIIDNYLGIATKEPYAINILTFFLGSPLKVIGLTGGIASGKSAITQWLAEQGAHVIDADKLGHRVYEAGSRAFDQVVEEFGREVVGDDGEINRRALGAKVFGDEIALKKLTDIAWPAIKNMAIQEIENTRKLGKNEVLVLEAAVLVEAEWMDIVDEVWVVTVNRNIAIQRASERDGLSREDVEKRIDAQTSDRERTKHATQVFDNSGSWTDLWNHVEAAYVELQKVA